MPFDAALLEPVADTSRFDPSKLEPVKEAPPTERFDASKLVAIGPESAPDPLGLSQPLPERPARMASPLLSAATTQLQPAATGEIAAQADPARAIQELDASAPGKLGEAPATIPQFGKPGTFARGISETASGLGEFILNKPEEFLASLYPPTAAAVALRYGPEMAARFGKDIWAGARGDKQALGRAATLAVAVAAPLGAKKAADAYMVGGPPKALLPDVRALRPRLPTGLRLWPPR
jgi:hypothetical protein